MEVNQLGQKWEIHTASQERCFIEGNWIRYRIRGNSTGAEMEVNWNEYKFTQKIRSLIGGRIGGRLDYN